MHKIRIIDNKKVAMTDDEGQLYENICASYDIPQQKIKGKDYFKNLFESDDAGIITFLKPPSTHKTSLEIYLFISSIMLQQNLRIVKAQMTQFIDESTRKIDEKLSSIK